MVAMSPEEMELLRGMIERCGIENVVRAIGAIADEKTFQLMHVDTREAKLWASIVRMIETLADKATFPN